jgi:hypothetical protein
MIDTLEIKMHCELVLNNVRKAWLIQNTDYSQEELAIVFDYIKTNYSSFIIETFRNNYFISRENLALSDKYSSLSSIEYDEYLGSILGYTCNRSIMKYGYDIVCDLIGINKYTLFSYGCSCSENSCSYKVDILVDRINNVISELEEFTDKSYEIYASRERIYSSKSLIDALITRPNNIIEDEKREINNYLYNIGFSECLHVAAMNLIFQYNNPVHIGILLGLLLNYENSLIDPFCPLQYGILKDSLELIDNVTKKWEDSIIDILQKTMV